MTTEKETIILEKLSHNETPVRQRELAEVAGLSLGMTNGLLKKMTDKGFLLMEKINSRNIRYILTSKGMSELNRRTRSYMKKTIKNVVYYREAIEELVMSASEMGFENILLIGQSDLDFILEWACQRHHIRYNGNEYSYKTYKVYSEKGLNKDSITNHKNVSYLINL
jgi:DNA-binding MarR family transcriptional regulator